MKLFAPAVLVVLAAPAFAALTLDHAIVPNANVVGRVDAKAVMQSPFAKEVQALVKQMAKQAPGAPQANPDEIMAKLGLNPEDVLTYTFSARIDAAQMESETTPDMLCAIKVAKPVKGAALAEVIKTCGETDVTVSESKVGSYTMLTLTPSNPCAGGDKVGIISDASAQGGIILMGPAASVEAAAKVAKTTPPAKAVVENLGEFKSSPVWVSFVLPEDMRAGIKEQVAAGAVPPGMDTLTGVAIGATPAQNLDLRAGLRFGSPAIAGTFSAMVNAQLDEFRKMPQAAMITSMLPTLSNSLKADAKGNSMGVGLTLTIPEAKALPGLAMMMMMGGPGAGQPEVIDEEEIDATDIQVEGEPSAPKAPVAPKAPSAPKASVKVPAPKPVAPATVR